ncbi:hypothetical protein NHX12_001538 [Muraenolepis orangiensis]|uniref:Protein FAM131B n=1 Tax=Muraenolepis orangiensis TaxID=630683 RepID=A0A9Q0DYM7_9TELE|nr:hypothetical protein NHX12_001538 [Muraenolepis orangiensis]
MKERVTKPTGMAQGRVAHMIEWQNWGMQTVGAGGVPLPRTTPQERENERRLENDAYSDLSDGEKEAKFAAGILQQFAISQATLMAWTSMDGESLRSGSNQGSVAHLSEVNQESITSRDQILHHSSADVWPHTYVSQGLYCLSSSDAWEPINNETSGVASPAAGSYVASPAAGSYVASRPPAPTWPPRPPAPTSWGSLEHRLHSANHSSQATPNSTIHSMAPSTHPPLVDLWNAVQTEAYRGEAGGYMGVAAVVEPSLGSGMGEDVIGTEHSPLLEQQEEEEFKSETATLTPPTRPGDVSSGGSSPGQPPAEPLTERKASDGFAQTLEEKGEGHHDGSAASMAIN